MISIVINAEYVDVHVRMAFVLTLIVQSNIWTLSNFFLEILCIYVVKNMEQFTYSKCKVTSLFWFAHFDMRHWWRSSIIDLFPFSGSHKHSAHFPCVFDWSKLFVLCLSFWIKHAIHLCIPSFKIL